jgi:hypothetical protein
MHTHPRGPFSIFEGLHAACKWKRLAAQPIVRVHPRAVVGGEKDESVVGYVSLFQVLHDLTDAEVHLLHHVPEQSPGKEEKKGEGDEKTKEEERREKVEKEEESKCAKVEK